MVADECLNGGVKEGGQVIWGGRRKLVPGLRSVGSLFRSSRFSFLENFCSSLCLGIEKDRREPGRLGKLSSDICNFF